MNKRAALVILVIVLFSLATGFLLFYLVGFTAKKAAWVAGGAGAAMIIFEVLIPGLRKAKTGKS